MVLVEVEWGMASDEAGARRRLAVMVELDEGVRAIPLELSLSGVCEMSWCQRNGNEKRTTGRRCNRDDAVRIVSRRISHST